MKSYDLTRVPVGAPFSTYVTAPAQACCPKTRQPRFPYARTLGFFLSVILAAGCGGYDPTEEPSVSVAGMSSIALSSDACETTPCNNEGSQTFTISDPEDAPLDLIWVIDNSGSMSNEAQQVRQNFTRFIDSLEGDTDLRVGLISAPFSGATRSQGVNLPGDGGENRKQVPTRVESNNGPLIAAMHACPASTTTLDEYVQCPDIEDFDGTPPSQATGTVAESYDVCGQTFQAATTSDTITCFLDGSTGTYLPNFFELARQDATLFFALNRAFDAGLGALSDFIRPEARLAFVFVTDDNAFGVDSSNFVSLIRSGLGKEPVVYSFRGTAADLASASRDCLIANVGEEYAILEDLTGGEGFSICEPDWSDNFDRLKNTVGAAAQNSVNLLQNNLCSITSVTVNGSIVSPSSYTLEGRSIVFDDGIIGAGSTVDVAYRFSDEPLDPPEAVLVGAPTGTTSSSVIGVAGPDVVAYSYQFLAGDAACPSLEDESYSDTIEVEVPITIPEAFLNAGTLCVFGVNNQTVFQCSPTRAVWQDASDPGDPGDPGDPSACADILASLPTPDPAGEYDATEPDISPVVECVTANTDGTYTALLGYFNRKGAPAQVSVSGSDNFFHYQGQGGQSLGQPTLFVPGRAYGTYTVDFDGSHLVWTLTGRTATAHMDQASNCSEGQLERIACLKGAQTTPSIQAK